MGKIVPHVAVPAGSSVGHGAVLAFAAVAEPPAGASAAAAEVPEPPEPVEVRQLADRVNGILQAAGLGRPVLRAERFLVAMRLAEGTDEKAVLRALEGENDEDLRRSGLWCPEEAEPRPVFDRDPADEPGRGADHPAGDSRTVPH
jgi:hypothetical protein